MIPLSTLLQHYKRHEIQEEIVVNAKDREVAVRYGDSGFGRRPDVLSYPKDVLEFAQKGATSFHASEELWKNPLQLGPLMNRKESDNLRHGWDLVLDIDCHFLDYSKIAADLVVKALKYNGVESVSVKFSGNKGFHIGVPFEAFPEKIGEGETRSLFPEAPRRIALYIKEMIKNPLSRKIMDLEKDISKIKEKTGKTVKEITRYETDEMGEKVSKLNAEPFLNIDTILISSRHLYRMPYSLHEKSGLVSIPVDPDRILEFDKETAKHPVKVSKFRFLDRSNVARGEAKRLIVQAFDFKANEEEKETARPKEQKEYEIPKLAMQEEYFPPCIQHGLKGLEDGKKRFLFILVNYLTCVGWDHDRIEEFVKEWNKRNTEQLRETTIVGHIRYHKKNRKAVLPPNCSNTMYYKDMRICKPDNLCQKIKNPVQYSMRKVRFLDKEEGKKEDKGKI